MVGKFFSIAMGSVAMYHTIATTPKSDGTTDFKAHLSLVNWPMAN